MKPASLYWYLCFSSRISCHLACCSVHYGLNYTKNWVERCSWWQDAIDFDGQAKLHCFLSKCILLLKSSLVETFAWRLWHHALSMEVVICNTWMFISCLCWSLGPKLRKRDINGGKVLVACITHYIWWEISAYPLQVRGNFDCGKRKYLLKLICMEHELK